MFEEDSEQPLDSFKKILISLQHVPMPCILCTEDTTRKIIYQPTERTKLIVGTPEEDHIRIPIVGLCEKHDHEKDFEEIEKAILNTIRNPKKVLRFKEGDSNEEDNTSDVS